MSTLRDELFRPRWCPECLVGRTVKSVTYGEHGRNFRLTCGHLVAEYRASYHGFVDDGRRELSEWLDR